LLVYRLRDLPLQDYGGTDHIPPELLADEDRFFRIELGGRPMGLRIAEDDKTVYVANYLQNAVQVVDLEDRTVRDSILLGGAEEPSLARRGAAIFYDADRSLDGWYSCHSCHYDGGTNSVAMDTMNDGTRFSFKTVLPLYNLRKTGPWTWHGWQQELDDAMEKSFQSTMQGPPILGEDRKAVIAFLDSLQPPPNPHRESDTERSAAVLRGKQIFESARGGCATCHHGPEFTDGEIHDVGLGSDKDRYTGFNTPSLKNVFRKVLYVHDGRSKSLDEVLSGPHAPENVAGETLSPQERSDLIAYVMSL
jgi:cytochrome c peroxidase